MLAPNGKRWKLIVLFGLAASLTNFLLGFSNAYPNTSGDSFQEFVNASYIEKGNLLTKWEFTWFWTTFLNIWAIGYLFGNLLTPFLCDHFGRKCKF
jgi:MFS family permease